MDKRAAASDDDDEFLSDQDAGGDDQSEFSVSEDEDGAVVQRVMIAASLQTNAHHCGRFFSEARR